MSKYLNSMKAQKGFTLIELLIIFTIIGILVSIAVPQFTAYEEKAYDSQAKATLNNLYLACKAFWADNSGTETCDLETVADIDYGFSQDSMINLKIRNGSESGFASEAQHKSSSKSYSIDSQGNITAL